MRETVSSSWFFGVYAENTSLVAVEGDRLAVSVQVFLEGVEVREPRSSNQW